MSRAALIDHLDRMIADLTPKRCRRAVRTLQAAICQVWSNVLDAEKALSYAAGYRQGQSTAQPSTQTQAGEFIEGWAAGYAAGLEHAIGRIGAPALPRGEDDEADPPIPRVN
jgi:hypothetical protein